MLHVPSQRKDLIKFANETVAICRASSGARSAYYRLLDAICTTGRADGGDRSLINLLPSNLDRLASHLFSPTELRFSIDFENLYPPNILAQADVAAKILTRDYERNNTDMLFGQGVYESLKYGAAILKQWVKEEGVDRTPVAQSALVMPWQFGVYREDLNSLERQEALCETTMLTMPEVWQRIHHMPDAEYLYKRIASQSAVGGSEDALNAFYHPVLSTSQMNTSDAGLLRSAPGGVVGINASSSDMMIGPQLTASMVKMHELWVKDTDDYTTIQIIGEDTLVAPRFKKSNLLISGDIKSGLHPYTLIQPNQMHGLIWGKSELADLIQPQEMLSIWAEDTKRLYGLQIDKILGFPGDDGMTDERYGQMRGAGYYSSSPGTQITDLTPKMPQEALAMLEFMIKIINMISGFDNMLSGQNEPGIRAGNHAETMVKMASPRLRDRSLLVERQCAAAGDLRMALMEAKDPHKYWTDGSSLEKQVETTFILSDLPEDRRVTVDSHSSSPIFADDHQQLIAFGVKSGFVDGHSAIEELPFPHKDKLQLRLKGKEEAAAAQLKQLQQSDPEAYAKLLEKSGGKHH